MKVKVEETTEKIMRALTRGPHALDWKIQLMLQNNGPMTIQILAKSLKTSQAKTLKVTSELLKKGLLKIGITPADELMTENPRRSFK